MSIGILKFKLPEEKLEFEQAQKAGALESALSQIANEIFRPARKHGYQDAEIQALLTRDTAALIELLEKEFFAILEEHGIVLY